jgi:hypothetical protein
MSFRLGNAFSESTPNLCRFRCVLITCLIRYELGIPQTTDECLLNCSLPQLLVAHPFGRSGRPAGRSGQVQSPGQVPGPRGRRAFLTGGGGSWQQSARIQGVLALPTLFPFWLSQGHRPNLKRVCAFCLAGGQTLRHPAGSLGPSKTTVLAQSLRGHHMSVLRWAPTSGSSPPRIS